VAVVAAMVTLPQLDPRPGGESVVVFSTRPSVSGCLLRSLQHSPRGYDQNEPPWFRLYYGQRLCHDCNDSPLLSIHVLSSSLRPFDILL